MKNKLLLTILSAIFTALLVIFCFNMPQLFSSYEYDVTSTFDLNEEKTTYESRDIINALKGAYEYYKGDISENNRFFTKEEVENELSEVLLYAFSDIEESDVNFLEFVPFKTPNGRNIWICSCKTEKTNRYFATLFDEATGKFVAYLDDKNTEKGVLYEDAYKKNYVPSGEALEEAYMKAEALVSMAADYYKLQVGQVWFEYSLGDQFIFNAELFDSEGETAVVRVSYNVSLGKYNFNF